MADHFANNQRKPKVAIHDKMYIDVFNLLNIKGTAVFIDGYEVYV